MRGMGFWAVLVLGLVLAGATVSSALAGGQLPDNDRLALASVHAAVARAGEPELLHAKNADRPVPIASITKLMTALVVLESGEPLDEWLEFLPRHQQAEANAYTRIREGSTLQRKNLIRLALMASENFAAYNLARHHPGGFEAFIADMNAKARELGMTSSRFVDPTGLSVENLSTAGDLVKLVNAALDQPLIGQYSTMGYYTARFRSPRYDLAYGNTNVLVHRGRWDVKLSKTGYLDEAGRCLVMVSTMGGQEVITVLLDSFGTRSPIGDAGRVRRWLETGDSGQVAGAAKRYEQEKTAALTVPDDKVRTLAEQGGQMTQTGGAQ